MDALSAAFGAWEALLDHGAENHEFVSGIKTLKNILAVRIARRDYPDGDGWPAD